MTTALARRTLSKRDYLLAVDVISENIRTWNPDGQVTVASSHRRYAALGDAVTASVSEWIGVRLLSGVENHRSTT